MSAHTPRISVCIPVRNGEKYLKFSIESILNQSYRDFELILCDNSSTDSTPAICQSYVERDSRVRYVRHATNLGPAENHNRGFNLARGEYFRWQAHDDVITPDFLQKCVDALDQNVDAVLVYPQTTIIDQDSNVLEQYDFTVDTEDRSAWRRFRRMLMVRHRQHRNFEIFGLTRRSALRQTPLEEPYAHGDRVLTVRLCLLGRFVHLREHLFLARAHASQSMQTLPTRDAGGKSQFLTRLLGPGPLPPPEWWNPALKGRVVFPDLNLLRQYWRSILNAPLPPDQRLMCYVTIAEWTVRNTPKFVRDIAFALDLLFAKVKHAMHRRASAALPEAATESGG